MPNAHDDEVNSIDAPSDQSDEPTPVVAPAVATEQTLFARVWGLGLIALMIATAPLWIQSLSGDDGYPRITWLSLLEHPAFERVIDNALLVVITVAVALQFKAPFRRWSWLLIGIALTGLILTDQHRLQPWAYQSVVYAVVLSQMPWREGRRWVAAVAISIYFYSALGKLDYQFIHTVGSQMVQALAMPIGGLGDTLATKLAVVLPLGELSIAVLLMIPRTRRLGGFLAIAMHTTLFLLLGPISLGHSYGVLAWNALLAAQSWLLFVRRTPPIESQEESSIKASPAPLLWTARAIVTLTLLMPLAERSGYWDHWTSWALYSPHNSRAEIQIHESARNKLSESMGVYLKEDDDGDRWRDLDIEAWSLKQRLAPVYPQARYQLALALELAEERGLDQAIRVKSKSVSDRWNGTRQETFLIGRREIAKAMSAYWLCSGR